jgi:hypothetical protein
VKSALIGHRWWGLAGLIVSCLPLGDGRLEGLVTEDDLRQLVGSLGVGAREPETEGWEHVISKGNDVVSYRAWCDKPTVLLVHLPLALLWQLIHWDGIVFACELRRENCPLGCLFFVTTESSKCFICNHESYVVCFNLRGVSVCFWIL